MRDGTHGEDGLTFEELDFAGQARSINGQIRSLEQAISAHIRRAGDEGRSPEQTKQKCLEQIEDMLIWVQEL